MRVLDFSDSFTSTTAPDVEGIDMGLTDYYYLGDVDTDGSWRWFINSGDLTFQKRVSGTWTDAHIMEAD